MNGDSSTGYSGTLDPDERQEVLEELPDRLGVE
jgi:hypothetical protein